MLARGLLYSGDILFDGLNKYRARLLLSAAATDASGNFANRGRETNE